VSTSGAAVRFGGERRQAAGVDPTQGAQVMSSTVLYGGERLHEWALAGELPGVNREVVDELMSTGAVVAGRGTFEPAGGGGGDHHDGVPIYISAGARTSHGCFAGKPASRSSDAVFLGCACGRSL
jgi:hypothetical protein